MQIVYALKVKIHYIIEKQQRKVIIIGGGISGIMTAYYLTKRNVEVELIEVNSWLGGRIHAIPFSDTYIEEGLQTISQAMDDGSRN